MGNGTPGISAGLTGLRGSLYADQFRDTIFEKDDISLWSPMAEAEKQCPERFKLVAGFKVAVEIPRRLGGGVMPAALKSDKRQLRKLLYTMRARADEWRGLGADYQEADPTPEDRAFGAQVDLQEWSQQRLIWLRTEQARVATYGLMLDLRKWTNRACCCFDNEIREITRITCITTS